MKMRHLCGTAAACLLFTGLAEASDLSRNSKVSAVQTFRNTSARPHWLGRSLVGSFTRTTSSVLGGIGKSGVKTVTRNQVSSGRLQKSTVVSVYRRGTVAASSVASINGEAARKPKH